MSYTDSLEIAKKLLSDPVPYVNTAVFLGMTQADWNLAMTVTVGFGSIIWTWFKIYHEWKKLQETRCQKPDTVETKRKKNAPI